MANKLLNYIKPNTNIQVTSPQGSTNPLEKYITPTTKKTEKTEKTETIEEIKTTNPLEKYISPKAGEATNIQKQTQQTQQIQQYDLMNPIGFEKMMNVPDEPFKMSTLGKRVLRDLAISIPIIGAGLIQWPVQAHRQTISEGLKIPEGLSPLPAGKTLISKEYTQPSGIGYLPTMVYNMLFRPGVEAIQQIGKPKELAKSYYQHPIIGPLGTISSLALPIAVAKGAVPKGAEYPVAASEGLYSPKATPEPSFTSKAVTKAYEKWQTSPKALKFKELTGLLPEQREYFNGRYNYELERADLMSQYGKSDLYNTLKAFTPKEKESFILNLEMAKPKTTQAKLLLKEAKIKIPKPTKNVSKALDLWKQTSEEGLSYMMEATSGTLFKGSPKGKLLTKSALDKGISEFKKSLIKDAKDFRTEVKKLGGIKEESIPGKYKGTIPKELIKKNGLPIEEVAKKFNITPDEVVLKLRKFSEMGEEFKNIAVEKMTKKFGYKVPIGEKPGRIKGEMIESSRWQPFIQALEEKTGKKFTIAELKEIGFEEPYYYHHYFPRDYSFRTRAYTGPSYSPGIWKERMGAQGYSREPLLSVNDYTYQLSKFKALNNFKDWVFDKFGKAYNEKNPVQTTQIKKGELVKYGKGKVLYETPDGMKIKVKTDVVIPRTVANEFNKMFTGVSRGEMFFRTYFDPITNTWKVPLLALSPRWVFNNFAGNFILNTLGGVGPGGYVEAAKASVKALKEMTKARKTGRPITFAEALGKQGIPEAVAEGIYSGEAGRAVEPIAVTKMQKIAKGAKWVPEKVYRFNSAIESFARSAHYFDKVSKGFDVGKAIASVNEFLFDYNRLTPVEKSVIRRIDPFWSWHKNITRLAVSYPIKYPYRAILLSYANKLGTEEYDDKLRQAGVNPDYVPDYYKSMYLLPWKDEEGKDFYISLRGIDPLSDVMPKLSNVHPIIRLIIERSAGINLYTMEPFSSPYTVYGKYEKVTPPLWRHILNNFPQFRVIEDVIRPYSIYDTGEPMVTKYGEPIYTKNKLLAVLSILGFNVKARDIEEIYRKAKEEERSKKKKEQSYERSREMFEQKKEQGFFKQE